MSKQIKQYVIVFFLLALLMSGFIFGLKGEEFFVVSLCIISIVLILFFIKFERNVRLSELLLMAVMSGVSIVGRVAFFFVPQVKPMAALVIITGISMGPEAGFATGVMAAFVSNFYFGQGTHTPFQMIGMGLVGFFAGILFHRKQGKYRKMLVVFFGGIVACFIYGFIVDLNTILMLNERPTWDFVMATYLVAMPMNLIHGGATMIFLLALYNPVLSRLERVQKKFGLAPSRDE